MALLLWQLRKYLVKKIDRMHYPCPLCYLICFLHLEIDILFNLKCSLQNIGRFDMICISPTLYIISKPWQVLNVYQLHAPTINCAPSILVQLFRVFYISHEIIYTLVYRTTHLVRLYSDIYNRYMRYIGCSRAQNILNVTRATIEKKYNFLKLDLRTD